MLLKDTIYIDPELKRQLQQLKLDLKFKDLDAVVQDMYKVYKEHRT
jgi:hypothetical protein